MGTSSRDLVEEIAVDTSGNVYVTGSTEGGLDGHTHSGEFDMFLVKFNSSGTKQWTKQLGSWSGDWGRGVASDPSGNIILIGSSNGGLDALVKYDASGMKLWSRQVGGASVTTDSSGNIFIWGSGGINMYDSDGNKQ